MIDSPQATEGRHLSDPSTSAHGRLVDEFRLHSQGEQLEVGTTWPPAFAQVGIVPGSISPINLNHQGLGGSSVASVAYFRRPFAGPRRTAFAERGLAVELPARRPTAPLAPLLF